MYRWGSGPRVVLIHGGVLGGRETWRGQRPLTERWNLLAVDRPGHGKTADARQDFENDAALVTEQLLDEPAHVVGYSYGGLVAAFAAAQRPESVLSLTIVEAPAIAVAPDNPVVAEWNRELNSLAGWSPDDMAGLLNRFFAIVGVPLQVSDPLPPALEKGARALNGMRLPEEAELPLEIIAALRIPTLVVTGGHLEPFEIIGDTIAARTNAERAVVPGMGHLVPDTGEPFNTVLEKFLTSASAS